MPESEFPLAYLITFHTYGSWLHGEVKGSVDREHNRLGDAFAPPDKLRVVTMTRRMVIDAMRLSRPRRSAVETAINDVGRHRGWIQHAVHARTNHVHVVMSAEIAPERVMRDLKAWATRRLRGEGLVAEDARVWSRHGSTRYLWDERAVESACRYVVEGQGVDLA